MDPNWDNVKANFSKTWLVVHIGPSHCHNTCSVCLLFSVVSDIVCLRPIPHFFWRAQWRHERGVSKLPLQMAKTVHNYQGHGVLEGPIPLKATGKAGGDFDNHAQEMQHTKKRMFGLGWAAEPNVRHTQLDVCSLRSRAPAVPIGPPPKTTGTGRQDKREQR